jgi:ADP-heptose:LPS heptosyltransferase/glycosyltransferase involved in cell wall biosynthesis
MPKLSVVIITFNEEKNIGRCLQSVIGIADEIIVLDSLSTDKTREICESYGVKFIQHPFLGYIDQKNKALSYASYPHVLSLDADEIISDELKRSILEAKENWTADGYYFNRLTNYCGKWIKHGGWYPDAKLRLWDTRKGKWKGLLIHEKVELEPGAKTIPLKGDLLHYSYYSIHQHIEQANRFSEIMAAEYLKKGKKANLFSLTIKPFWWFIKSYFLRAGFLDGFYGFLIAIVSSHANFLKFVKLKQLYIENKSQRNYSSVIISRTDSIGDVLLTLPLAGIIKSKYPDVKVIFLGSAYTQPIISACNYVDVFINWDEIRTLSKQEQIDYFASLKADAIIHVFPKSDISKVAKWSKIPVRIGTSHRFHHWMYCNKLVHFGRRYSKLHESQLNIKLLKPLGMHTDFILNEIRNYYGLSKISVKQEHESLISRDKFNILLHPKSKGSAREWGLENFGRLIELLPPDKFKIFLSGTKEDKSLLKPLLDKYQHLVTDISGTMNLTEFIGFISLCDGMVAASTGPLHIAAALNKTAIGLFAPMRPIHPTRWGPVGLKAKALVIDKKCSKCRNSGDCECIRAIQPEQVAAIVKER